MAPSFDQSPAGEPHGHAPRTPADIGRDIAAAQQRIVDLKAELACVPPKTLELTSSGGQATLTFTTSTQGGSSLGVCRDVHYGSWPVNGFTDADVTRLKDWLNYYYPEA